jgi:hypothetical protein
MALAQALILLTISTPQWPDRSIVDQDVDPAELGQRPDGQRLDLGLFADVGENRIRLDPQIPGLTRDGLSLLLIGARVAASAGRRAARCGSTSHRSTLSAGHGL